MASGRRGEAQRAQREFLENNENLIDFSTTIRAVKDPNEGIFEPEVTIGLDTFPGFVDGFIIGIPNKISVVSGVETPNSEIYGARRFDPDEWEDGDVENFFIPLDGPNDLSISKFGFGVTNEGDFFGEDDHGGGQVPNIQVLGVEKEEFAGTREARAINDDELLILEIDSPYYGPKPIIEPFGEDYGWMNMGGTELEIDYEVLGGRGTVEIMLFDYDTEQTIVHEVEIPRGSQGDEGNILIEVPEGFAFEEAAIGVTGSAKIAVSEIGYATTTDGMIFEPT